MFFKTSELQLNKPTFDSIEEHWNHDADEFVNLEVLDDARRLEMVLRISYIVAGGTNHMRIPSRLEIKKQKQHFVISMYCNFLKPILVSLILAALTALLFVLVHSNILFAVLFTAPISLGCFVFFYLKIRATSRDYFAGLKREALKSLR